MTNSPLTVTSPLLPPLEEYIPYLQEIWQSRYITNNGHFHQLLEQALQTYLGCPYLSVFTNGTLPLITALQALHLDRGEVITTPYSFVATTHSIWWNKLQPVFVDIDPVTGDMDPAQIEAAITERTVAIMPVHVYGTPCDTQAIDAIAQRHGLKVIYDAAHAFGVTVAGKSVLLAGDMSTLSFHATKTYNTVEGGALVTSSQESKKQVDELKNFGFVSETEVVQPGINSKMDELRAAYGLLNLKYVDRAIAARKAVAERYIAELQGVEGICLYEPIVQNTIHETDIRLNYSYFPIFIEPSFRMSRDSLYEHLKGHGILSRRYFYPLISTFEPYSSYSSASPKHLPVATRIANEVLCLPMHHLLSEQDIERVVKGILG